MNWAAGPLACALCWWGRTAIGLHVGPEMSWSYTTAKQNEKWWSGVEFVEGSDYFGGLALKLAPLGPLKGLRILERIIQFSLKLSHLFRSMRNNLVLKAGG